MQSCVDNRDNADVMEMACEPEETIEIQGVYLWQIGSGANCKTIDLNSHGVPRLYCRKLSLQTRELRRRCKRKRFCVYESEYHVRHNCPGGDVLPSPRHLLKIAYECVSRKYLFLCCHEDNDMDLWYG